MTLGTVDFVELNLLFGTVLRHGAIGDGYWASQASPSEPSAVRNLFASLGCIGRNRASDLD